MLDYTAVLSSLQLPPTRLLLTDARLRAAEVVVLGIAAAAGAAATLPEPCVFAQASGGRSLTCLSLLSTWDQRPRRSSEDVE